MAQRLSESEPTHEDLTTVLPEDVPDAAPFLTKKITNAEPSQDIKIERVKKPRRKRSAKALQDKSQGEEGRENR